MATVTFRFGNQSAYDALKDTGYDSNSLYFIEDTQRLYKGEKLMSEQAIFTDSMPDFSNAVEDRIYVVKNGDDVSFYVKGESSMVQAGGGKVAEGAITDVGAFSDNVLAKSTDGELSDTDTKIPTEGAVKKAIEEAVASVTSTSLGLDEAFVDVKAEAAPEGQSGTVLTFTPKSGEEKKVTIADLFISSGSYDKETHILTLKVGQDAKEVEVNLEDLIPKEVDVDSTQVKMNYGETGVLTATVNVGNIKIGDKISLTEGDGTVKADTVQAMFAAILSKDIDPVATAPSAKVEITNKGEKEVGTKISPAYKITFTDGKYSVGAGSSSAVQAKCAPGEYSLTDNVQSTKTGSSWSGSLGNASRTATGTFDEITVEDSTSYKVSTATMSWGAGEEAKSYLGTAKPNVTLPKKDNQNITINSDTITGYRNCYWGYKTKENKISNPAEITKEQIKALGNSGKTKPTLFKGVPAGSVQLFFAVPSTQANTVEITQSNPVTPVTLRGTATVQVGGVGDYSPIDYKVFWTEDGETIAAQDYTISWK